MSELAERQRRLLEVLARHRVELVVVGGVAAQVHGWTGATLDLDITVSIEDENVVRLNAALRELGAGQPSVGALGTVYETRFGRLEIVRRADGIGEYGDWARRASPRAVAEGLTVVVADPRDVVRSKEASGRRKDLDVLPKIRRDLIDAGVVDRADAGDPVAPAESPARPAPPEHLVELLGPRPDGRVGARWDLAVQAVLDYRERWEVDGPGLGEAPADPGQASDRKKLLALVERVRGRG